MRSFLLNESTLRTVFHKMDEHLFKALNLSKFEYGHLYLCHSHYRYLMQHGCNIDGVYT